MIGLSAPSGFTEFSKQWPFFANVCSHVLYIYYLPYNTIYIRLLVFTSCVSSYWYHLKCRHFKVFFELLIKHLRELFSIFIQPNFCFHVTNLVWMLELVKLSQHCLLELVRLNSDPYSPRGNFVRVRKNKVKPNNAPYYFFRLASLKQARMKQIVTAITDWIVNLSYKYS